MVYLSSFLKVKSYSLGCYVYTSPSVFIGCVILSECDLVFGRPGYSAEVPREPSDPRANFALVPRMDSIKVQFQRESGSYGQGAFLSPRGMEWIQ